MKPASTSFNLTEENITTYTCPTFDIAQMLEEDAQDEELGGKPYRFAKSLQQIFLRLLMETGKLLMVITFGDIK